MYLVEGWEVAIFLFPLIGTSFTYYGFLQNQCQILQLLLKKIAQVEHCPPLLKLTGAFSSVRVFQAHLAACSAFF